jgi:hypothetical protein
VVVNWEDLPEKEIVAYYHEMRKKGKIMAKHRQPRIKYVDEEAKIVNLIDNWLQFNNQDTSQYENAIKHIQDTHGYDAMPATQHVLGALICADQILIAKNTFDQRPPHRKRPDDTAFYNKVGK